ncbi:zinc-dependent metalloprotease [Flavobacterium caeni]|uniref:Por secretion system C-terminal sorting domain-containing protein n=1 Tax=Flavobacterium caeni TaxID=490189 RepID=A0A1G5JS19_9FLAO|nr:zinc-dependent metalloprotease family protein [Flavobacterium caeni]SCY91193.1 Por secretion system C-terminal sorting domain-containing protein [Flavobacterium caeni]
MKKSLLMALAFCATSGWAQTNRAWTAVSNTNVKPSKTVQRQSFPADFTLMRLAPQTLRAVLQTAPQRNVSVHQSGVIISLPNVQGQTERFEMLEASNFVPEFQAQHPEIRAYVGKGIDDKNATVRLSVDPSGIQGMVFRTDKRNEFIEPYAEGGDIYAVYNASRNKGSLPFTCSTEDVSIAKSLEDHGDENRSNSGELLTFRLALSCNAEYTNYFGGVAQALAAMNATMTRVNGVFEMDMAIHMNMIDNTDLIFTNPSTDPYTTIGQWNSQLQNLLNDEVGNANYDIGHMFGSTGGGGSAGCIGCVCVNGQKGSAKTSPADGVPMGDTFDIDYVAHEMGHQFGANHTFSHGVEGTGVNVEPGSGSTIMGYAGITNWDIANHSDAYFVYASIKQVQDNMVGKTCPVRTPLANTAPTVDAGADYIIPISTPYVLTGSATDAQGDTLLYCWEQNDSATSQTGGSSPASPTKTGGPNWRSYDPTLSPSRYMPPLARVVNNQLTSTFGSVTTEAISSVARECNFVLTVRDRDLEVGQTASDFMKVTTVAAAGPFIVNTPNTNISVMAATNYDVTWNVAGTTGNGVNAATVDIFLSTDGGFTYPYELANNVPNDGTQAVVFPDVPGTTNRVMVKGHNHIFYDISNTNFTITTAVSTFVISAPGGTDTQTSCQGGQAVYTILYDTINGFDDPTTFSLSGQPAGTTVSFSQNPVTTPGQVTLTVSNTNAAPAGAYTMTLTGTSGSEVKTLTLYYDLFATTFPASVLTTPANGATTQPTTLTLEWDANANASSYDIQVATDAGFTTGLIEGTTDTNSYQVTGLATGTTYYWRILPKNASCSGELSAAFSFQTGMTSCDDWESTDVPVTISASGAPTVNSTLVIPAGEGADIESLTVTVDITHTWVRDLTVTLISPAGSEARLVNRPCTNAALNNIQATFDDEGIVLICANNPAVGGTIIPFDALSAFVGENTEGTWTLRVADQANQDGGAINSWSINVCSTQELGVAQSEFTDFALYPNPNNGAFDVRFTPNSDDVKINVHDMRGRQIFNQAYRAGGMFQETIQLRNASSGIYMVTVENGSSRVVKKIVIE